VRNGKAECRGGLAVYRELKIIRLANRQVGRFGAFQYLVDIGRGLAKQLGLVSGTGIRNFPTP